MRPGPTNPKNLKNWRRDDKPVFKKPSPIDVPIDALNCPPDNQALVRQICIQQYQKSMQLIEHSVADVALQYTTKNPENERPFADKFRNDGSMRLPNEPGAISQFANVYSQRYLDLYHAYIEWEMTKGIPMLPVTAGQMKLHGFTSEDIVKMKDSCAQYSKIADTIKTVIPDPIHYGKVIAAMVGMDKDVVPSDFISKPDVRERLLSFIDKNQRQNIGNILANEFKNYLALPEKDMIDKAHFLMHDFGHLEYTDIALQLYYVGIMKPIASANKDERFQMEIRHRVAGDMSIHQNSPGTLGGNPLAYLNMLKNGEKDNPEAEFRNKMYFVYMNNHFANAVIRDQERIDFINTWLKDNNKGWQLDEEFIDAMKARGPQYIPPIFRYGANAAINRQLREMRSHHEVEEFYKENPNISIREVMENLADRNTYYRLKLSDRELMNQIGEWQWNQKDKNRPWTPVNFGTGAAVFKLYTTPTNEMSDSAKAYLEQVNEFGLPVYAGISGTLDQSTAMAGLVGLGVDEDLKRRELELHTIKLAYLAFMLPGRDHSVHEIMQSSMSYGLDYVPGPGFEKYIYPVDPTIVEQIREQQHLRGSELPGYYLSTEFVQETLENLNTSALNPNITASLNKTTSTTTPPSKTTDPVSHYIGLTVTNTALDNALKLYQREGLGIDWIPSANLHITIGWIENKQNLTPKEQQEITQAIAPLAAQYEDLLFRINSVEMWGHQKDVIITLNDVSNQFETMRKLFQEKLKSMGIDFQFHSTPHVTIGRSQTPIKTEEIQKFFGELPNDRYSFGHCSLMHTDPKYYHTQVDHQLLFKYMNSKLTAFINEQKSSENSEKRAPPLTPKNDYIRHKRPVHADSDAEVSVPKRNPTSKGKNHP